MPDLALGDRVRLSALGREYYTSYAPPTDTGIVKDVKQEGRFHKLLVHREGLRHPTWYYATFWERVN